MILCKTCMNVCDMDKLECGLYEEGIKPPSSKPVPSMSEMIRDMLNNRTAWFPSPIQGTPLVIPVPFLDTEHSPNRTREGQEDEQEETEHFEGARVFTPPDWVWSSTHNGNTIGTWDRASSNSEE